jgi:DNA-binding transcriptional LysR family regulator
MTVADSGSFSAAAEKLYTSRPALIQQINLLESRMGFKLFLRSPKGVSLTSAGRCFYDGARQIVEIAGDIKQRCMAESKAFCDTIRIGTLPNFAPVVLPMICQKFIARFPGIHIQFEEYSLENYFRSFSDGLFDITTEYMCGYVFDRPGHQFIRLLQDKHCCGVSPSHALAGKKRVSFKDLRGQKLILYAKGITRADDELRGYLTKNEPEIELIDIKTYNSALSVKCELESCVLIYYSMYWKSFPTLTTIPVEWNFPIDIGLGYKTKACENPAVSSFIKFAREMYPASTVEAVPDDRRGGPPRRSPAPSAR